MGYAVHVPPGKRVDLSRIDPDADGGLSKVDGTIRADGLTEELGELQELLYAAGTHALLIVLQGMDTAGKDGTIRKVLREVNPQGCHVTSFKVPTEEELGHDFLWRIHKQTPLRGLIGVFNRSHYEDVVVVRVKELVPEPVWRAHYDQINTFEQLLTASNTLIAKFYLHISKEEQEGRLLDREKEVEKAWKLSAGDWIERQAWDDYIAAYEDALTKCNTDVAPWHVIPANRKWFRDVAVADTLVNLLRPFRDDWLSSLKAMGQEELKRVKATRKHLTPNP
ncbi:MAG: PPK2 family polyphosphate kinase [Thermomicrobiales bacterium]